MERTAIIQQVTDIFKDVLDDGKIVLTDATTADDIAEWDSLNHIHLVVAIEKKFNIRFAVGEMQRWKNVGQMIDSISAKIK
jgi:acyl carrier protein